MRVDSGLLQMLLSSKIEAMAIKSYELSDHIFSNSQKVILGANQVGFVVGFSAVAQLEFSLELLSGTTKHIYDATNTLADSRTYSSPMISSHLGSILINNYGGLTSYQLRVIILTIKQIG